MSCRVVGCRIMSFHRFGAVTPAVRLLSLRDLSLVAHPAATCVGPRNTTSPLAWASHDDALSLPVIPTTDRRVRDRAPDDPCPDPPSFP